MCNFWFYQWIELSCSSIKKMTILHIPSDMWIVTCCVTRMVGGCLFVMAGCNSFFWSFSYRENSGPLWIQGKFLVPLWLYKKILVTSRWKNIALKAQKIAKKCWYPPLWPSKNSDPSGPPLAQLKKTAPTPLTTPNNPAPHEQTAGKNDSFLI